MSSRGYKRTQRVIENRRKEAEDRQALYDKLTLKEKLERLPPEPQAKKVRAKLLAQASKPNTASGLGKVMLESSSTKEVNVSSETEPKKLKAKDRRAQEKKD